MGTPNLYDASIIAAVGSNTFSPGAFWSSDGVRLATSDGAVEVLAEVFVDGRPKLSRRWSRAAALAAVLRAAAVYSRRPRTSPPAAPPRRRGKALERRPGGQAYREKASVPAGTAFPFDARREYVVKVLVVQTF